LAAESKTSFTASFFRLALLGSLRLQNIKKGVRYEANFCSHAGGCCESFVCLERQFAWPSFASGSYAWKPLKEFAGKACILRVMDSGRSEEAARTAPGDFAAMAPIQVR